MRIFAGPNGSGKSSMLNKVINKVPLGYYINADEIEKQIIDKKQISLDDFGIAPDNKTLRNFFKKSDFVKNKSDAKKLNSIFSINQKTISVSAEDNLAPKYAAAIIADFLRSENLKAGNDFSFETVMSHADKIAFIKKAIKAGYHVYLYFICTDDVRVNIDRVKARVKENGHDVPQDKIRTRYIRTLDLLYDALKVCYKSYLFDNSNNMLEIARVNRDRTIHLQTNLNELPGWFIRAVLNKI